MFIFFMFSVDVFLDICRTVLQMLLKSAHRQLMRIYFNMCAYIFCDTNFISTHENTNYD